MVSFSCEVCNDTVVKKKLDQHVQRCYGAYFTCIDCSVTFQGSGYKQHTSCITEAEKYEKGLFKGKKQNAPANAATQKTKSASNSKPEPTKAKKSETVDKKSEADEHKQDKKSKSQTKKNKEKAKKIDLKSEIKVGGESNLYKVVKKVAKKSSKSSKDILKNINIKRLENGSLELCL